MSTQRVGAGPGRLARVGLPLVALAAVVGLVAAAATGRVSLAGRADPPQALADRPGGGATGATDARGADAGSGELTPQRAFARAAYRLDEAGTFAYRGTVDLRGPSLARPGVVVGGLTSVEGEVELPARTHEIAIAMDGFVSETAIRNVAIWARVADDEGELDAQPFEIVGELRGDVAVPSGAALLPEWLMATTDRRAEARDGQGRARFRAHLPSWTGVVGDVRAGPAAEVVLTVDGAGDPAHVTVTADVEGRRLGLDLEIERLGEPVGEWLPGGRPTSVIGDVTAEDVAAAGIPHAVELGDVPDGWILFHTDLRTDSPGPGCSTLELWYQHADEVDMWQRYISLDVTSADCSLGSGWDRPMTLGGFSGAGRTTDGVIGYVSDGQSNIEVSSDLPVEELDALFATMEPFDPTTRPEDPD